MDSDLDSSSHVATCECRFTTSMNSYEGALLLGIKQKKKGKWESRSCSVACLSSRFAIIDDSKSGEKRIEER